MIFQVLQILPSREFIGQNVPRRIFCASVLNGFKPLETEMSCLQFLLN